MTRHCIVFDVDDTLYLERDYVRSGFAAVGTLAREQWKLEDFAAQAWQLFEAGARNDIFDRVLRAAGVAYSGDDVARMVACYRAHRPAIQLLDDARACLEQLGGRFVLAGLTDGPAESQHAKVIALDLPRWLSPLVVTADLGPDRGKPHPAGFRLIEEAHGASGAACTYVADNPAKDFVAPRSLGWRTVRIRRPDGLHAARASSDDVDIEVSSLDDFCRIAL